MKHDSRRLPLLAAALFAAALPSPASELQDALDNWALSFSSAWYNEYGNYGGSGGWYETYYDWRSGGSSATNVGLDDGESAVLSTTVNGPGIIQFAWSVDSERGYDYVDFFIDGVRQIGWSGYMDWVTEAFEVGSGSHTLQWIYEKDSSQSRGLDSAWVDAVGWTGDGSLVPIFRFYSPGGKSHFFTRNITEQQDLRFNSSRTWNYEGVAFYGWRPGTYGTTPLYRFYSPSGRSHFYTANYNEMVNLRTDYRASQIWRYEGVAYNVKTSLTGNSRPVYRFYSPRNGRHFYTANYNEMVNLRTDSAAVRIWNYEGIGFYVWAPSSYYRKKSAPGPESDEFPSETDLLPEAGVVDLNGATLELRLDAPEATTMASADEAADAADPDVRAFRLPLSEGVTTATLWNAADGAEETLEEAEDGAVRFALPATGVWHWLRAEGGLSLWMRLDP